MELYQPLMSLNWNMLFTAITVIVLFFILKHFFFEKVHNFMVQREKEIQDSLDNAAKTNEEADKRLQIYEEKLAGADSESRQILKAARDEAKVQAKEILDDAGEKARALIEHSQKEIRREKYNARKELQEELSTLAVMAAEKIVEKELNPEDQKEIVDKIIEEAEEKPWS